MYWERSTGKIAFVSNLVLPTLEKAGGVAKCGFPQNNAIPALEQEFGNTRIVVSESSKLSIGKK